MDRAPHLCVTVTSELLARLTAMVKAGAPEAADSFGRPNLSALVRRLLTKALDK